METKNSTGWSSTVLAVVLVAGVLLAVVAAAATPIGGSYGMMGGGSWGGGILMMTAGALVLIVFLLAVLGVLRGATLAPAQPANLPPPASALEVLDRRYARGELSREDYLRIRGDLTHGSSQP